MKTIAFYNNKGGVGKTTLAANVGYNLSTMGYRVLLVDCDPQGNLSSFFGRYDLTKMGLMQHWEDSYAASIAQHTEDWISCLAISIVRHLHRSHRPCRHCCRDMQHIMIIASWIVRQLFRD